eukprot:SM000301S11766  [mRNA]  locus=s301:3602:9104:- [translate_table: standard]
MDADAELADLYADLGGAPSTPPAPPPAGPPAPAADDDEERFLYGATADLPPPLPLPASAGDVGNAGSGVAVSGAVPAHAVAAVDQALSRSAGLADPGGILELHQPLLLPRPPPPPLLHQQTQPSRQERPAQSTPGRTGAYKEAVADELLQLYQQQRQEEAAAAAATAGKGDEDDSEEDEDDLVIVASEVDAPLEAQHLWQPQAREDAAVIEGAPEEPELQAAAGEAAPGPAPATPAAVAGSAGPRIGYSGAGYHLPAQALEIEASEQSSSCSPVAFGLHQYVRPPAGTTLGAHGRSLYSASRGGSLQKPPPLDFSLPPHKTVFDVDLDALDDKLWRRPGADISDYFNFGLNELTWKEYCLRLIQLKLESAMQNKIRVYESGRPDTDIDPDMPRELVALLDPSRLNGAWPRPGGGKPTDGGGGGVERRATAELRRSQRPRDPLVIVELFVPIVEQPKMELPKAAGGEDNEKQAMADDVQPKGADRLGNGDDMLPTKHKQSKEENNEEDGNTNEEGARNATAARPLASGGPNVSQLQGHIPSSMQGPRGEGLSFYGAPPQARLPIAFNRLASGPLEMGAQFHAPQHLLPIFGSNGLRTPPLAALPPPPPLRSASQQPLPARPAQRRAPDPKERKDLGKQGVTKEVRHGLDEEWDGRDVSPQPARRQRSEAQDSQHSNGKQPRFAESYQLAAGMSHASNELQARSRAEQKSSRCKNDSIDASSSMEGGKADKRRDSDWSAEARMSEKHRKGVTVNNKSKRLTEETSSTYKDRDIKYGAGYMDKDRAREWSREDREGTSTSHRGRTSKHKSAGKTDPHVSSRSREAKADNRAAELRDGVEQLSRRPRRTAASEDRSERHRVESYVGAKLTRRRPTDGGEDIDRRGRSEGDLHHGTSKREDERRRSQQVEGHGEHAEDRQTVPRRSRDSDRDKDLRRSREDDLYRERSRGTERGRRSVEEDVPRRDDILLAAEGRYRRSRSTDRGRRRQAEQEDDAGDARDLTQKVRHGKTADTEGRRAQLREVAELARKREAEARSQSGRGETFYQNEQGEHIFEDAHRASLDDGNKHKHKSRTEQRIGDHQHKHHRRGLESMTEHLPQAVDDVGLQETTNSAKRNSKRSRASGNERDDQLDARPPGEGEVAEGDPHASRRTKHTLEGDWGTNGGHTGTGQEETLLGASRKHRRRHAVASQERPQEISPAVLADSDVHLRRAREDHSPQLIEQPFDISDSATERRDAVPLDRPARKRRWAS